MIAATAVSMLPWPEIITTGSSGCWVLMLASNCKPSSLLPCSQMSKKIKIRSPRRDRGQRFVAVPRGAGTVAFVLEYSGDEIANVGFVVDD